MCNDCDSLRARVAELEQQVVDIRNGYRMTIWQLKDHLCGKLSGMFHRDLETMSQIIHLDLPQAPERARFTYAALSERIDRTLKTVDAIIAAHDPRA